MAMFTNITRFHKVSDSVIVGASGDYSDFQYIRDQLDALTREYRLRDDGVELTASEVHNYLSRVLYNRRNKMDPLWNSLVVAGVDGGVSYDFVHILWCFSGA
jgi:20S proteasome subunit beta 7